MTSTLLQEMISRNLLNDYLRPFTKRIEGEDLKVYFWNRDQKEMPFRNFTIFVTH